MQSHLTQERRYASPSFRGQQGPDRRRQIAHRGIQANAPGQIALQTRFSVICPASSIYERHRGWDIEEFYREDNQTILRADAFPVLFSLQQLHQILAQGAGNVAAQVGFAARVETLMMQLMLAQPELRAFLRVREMVPYAEPWQASVDAMIDLQGWQQPLTSQHGDCAKFGERILLSIRLADWTAGTEVAAGNWVRRNREAIRRFMYAQSAINGGELVAATVSRASRPALAGGARPSAIPDQRRRAYPELGFAPQADQGSSRIPRQFAPRLPDRG